MKIVTESLPPQTRELLLFNLKKALIHGTPTDQQLLDACMALNLELKEKPQEWTVMSEREGDRIRMSMPFKKREKAEALAENLKKQCPGARFWLETHV